jgi:hypothetical protein
MPTWSVEDGFQFFFDRMNDPAASGGESDPQGFK